MPLAAALFDLDGTLVDTAPDLHAAASAALEDLQMPAVPFSEAREYIGDGMPRFIKRLVTRQWWGEPADGVYERASARLAHHYMQHCVNSRPYAGVESVLQQCAQQGIKMACVTNKAERYTLPLLAACGLEGFFAAVVCGDTLEVKKPHPAPLLTAMQTLCSEAAETVMVGDSITDSRAAAAAGCKFICMTYGYHRQNTMPPADLQADEFAQIPALLAGI